MNAVLSYDIDNMNPVRIISNDEKPEIPGWACAGMPQHWYSAFRMAWAHDVTGYQHLEWKLWDMAIRMAIRHGWKVPTGQERLRKMARLAIHELIDPARYRKLESWKLRVATVGCGKTQWFALWQARYEMIYGELNDWVNRAFRFIRVKQQRGEV